MEGGSCAGLFLSIFTLLISLTTVNGDKNFLPRKNYCTWYGQSNYTNPATNKLYNQFFNGPAKSVSPGTEFFNLLNETCPWLITNDTKTCCDINQLRYLKNQTAIVANLVQRCPACYHNFMHHFCATTCDPNLSTFVDVFDRSTNTSYIQDGGYLSQVYVYVTHDYASRLFNSCKNVEYPEQSGKVMSLMCGRDDCNGSYWLRFLGDPSLDYGQAPFLMNYVFTDKPPVANMISIDSKLFACDDTIHSYACSCTDCPSPKLCPSLPPQMDKWPHIRFIIVLVVLSCGLSITTLITLFCYLYTLFTYIKFNQVVKDGGLSSNSYGTINENEECLDDNVQNNCGPCIAVAQVGAWVEFVIRTIFYYWGVFASKYWFVVLPLALIISFGLAGGIYFFHVTTDPVKLWSAPGSRARQEKNYFDQEFSPFYRTSQIIIRPKKDYGTFSLQIPDTAEFITFGSAMHRDVLIEAFYLQQNLSSIVAYRYNEDGSNSTVTLKDICFKPLYPDNDKCTIQSIFNYFQNDYDTFFYNEGRLGTVVYNASYHIDFCAKTPTAIKDKFAKEKSISCLAAYGGPVDPNTALGGFSQLGSVNDYDGATALIITFIINNHDSDAANADAKLWEAKFIEHMQSYKNFEYIDVSFSTERSITDEINRESRTDVITIGVSYLCMFLYIALFLGKFRSISTILVDLKILLGLSGVSIVLLSVGASLGFFSYMGVEASLIILEVVPFLVLAVGVDNLFILVHSYERNERMHSDLEVNEVIGRTLAEVAPTLLLTSFSECSAFLLGAISSMPAVRAFSLYAGMAVIFNLMLQMSAFVSVMALDALRQKNYRLECICCFKLDRSTLPNIRYRDGLITMFMKRFWSYIILHKFVRPAILFFFGCTFFTSLAGCTYIQVGLDQNLALPKDSYLQDYFTDLYTYLHIGAPVYFVIEDGFNYSDYKKQSLICSGSSCAPNSLGTQISVAAQHPDITRIAEPASIWLDSYFQWLSPTGTCCGYNRTDGNQCQNPKVNTTCIPCMEQSQLRPNTTQFLKFLHPFLSANPNTKCAAAGHAAYSSAVVVKNDGITGKTYIKTSYTMTYHTILRNSSAFIDAMKQARLIGDNLTETLGVTVFPYSVFYVYYEQYLHIVNDMVLNIGLSLGAVFLVTTALLGLNIWGAFIIISVVFMILVHMGGIMAALSINANAVSLVNLVMTVGIAVEFCSHIVRWFISSKMSTRLERAHSALGHMGSSVLSGITLTKFIGVFILFFSKSQLFFVYYFQMYICMVIIGAAHGLVFLPVLLSYIGPPYYPVKTRSPYPLTRSDVEHDSRNPHFSGDVKYPEPNHKHGNSVYPQLSNERSQLLNHN